MELKATSMGKRTAQHPYDKVVLLNAGVKVSGERHEYLIPFNQLLAIHCKRGLVWGAGVRLAVRQSGAASRDRVGGNPTLPLPSEYALATVEPEMSVIAAQVLDDIALSNTQQKWLTRQQTAGLQQKLPCADGIAFTGGAA